MEKHLIDSLIQNIKVDNPNLGLFTGISGECLYLFLIGNKYQYRSEEISNIAESLIDKIYDQINTIQSTSFSKGLSGIGWMLNQLSQYGFIRGNIDNILWDIDSTIYRFLNNSTYKLNISCTNGYIGYLMYIVSRLENPFHKKDTILHKLHIALLRTIIDKIGELMPHVFFDITKDLYISFLWDFPLLFIYLKKALDLNVYSMKLKSLIKDWGIYINGLTPYYNLNRLYLALSLAYLNQSINSIEIDKKVKILLYSLDYDQIKTEINGGVHNINEGCFFPIILLYLGEKYFQIDEMNTTRQTIIQNFVIDITNHFEDPNADFSLLKGVGGLAYVKCQFPDILK